MLWKMACIGSDPSNEDTAIDRNFLRREIIPKLEQRWPGLGKALGRTARHCAEAQQLAI